MTRWWRSHSVRVRLTVWYVATTVIVLVVYALAIVAIVSRNRSNALAQQLRRDFQLAAATLYEAPDGSIQWSEPEQILAEQDPLWIQVWTIDGRELLFRNAEAERQPIPQSQALAPQITGGPVTVPMDPVPMRIYSRQSGNLEGTRRYIIQVARSEAQMRAEMAQLLFILELGLPLAVLVSGVAGYTLARRALVPIERMTDRARHITAENLSERLPVDNPEDEMGRLATVFNQTLGRLEASFEQMRRFTADVSHELRTPLTAIRSVGEVGLRQQRDDEGYRAIIGSMLEEVDRLATLVDRLLTLSRAETVAARFNIEPIDLRTLGEDVAGHLSVLAEEKGQTITVEAEGDARVMADRTLIRQALICLVDNAIKFSPQKGTVRIRIYADGARALIDVVDSGPGIDPAVRERIFDRFYRVQDGGETKGTGLGLSIARGAVEANGGRLTLAASGPHGSTFRIALPRAV